jgi:hypothetical protein
LFTGDFIRAGLCVCLFYLVDKRMLDIHFVNTNDNDTALLSPSLIDIRYVSTSISDIGIVNVLLCDLTEAE